MGLLDSFKSLLRSKVNIRNRFELLEEAISGTMSSFYMARDRQSGQIVGLKVLDREKTQFLESRFTGLQQALRRGNGDAASSIRTSSRRWNTASPPTTSNSW